MGNCNRFAKPPHLHWFTVLAGRSCEDWFADGFRLWFRKVTGEMSPKFRLFCSEICAFRSKIASRRVLGASCGPGFFQERFLSQKCVLGYPYGVKKKLRAIWYPPTSWFWGGARKIFFVSPLFLRLFAFWIEKDIVLGALLTSFWGSFSETADFQNIVYIPVWNWWFPIRFLAPPPGHLKINCFTFW